MRHRDQFWRMPACGPDMLPVMRDEPDPEAPIQSSATASLSSLFGRNLEKLHAFLRVRCGDRLSAKESIEDLAQSVCREVLRDAEGVRFTSEAAFRKWLFTQATRKLIDKSRYYARAHREAVREAPEVDEASAASVLSCYADFCTPSRYASAREQLEQIEAAIQQLPDAQRDAIAFVKLLGLSTREAAERLQISDSAVRSLLSRGLAKLSLTLRPRSSDPADGR